MFITSGKSVREISKRSGCTMGTVMGMVVVRAAPSDAALPFTFTVMLALPAAAVAEAFKRKFTLVDSPAAMLPTNICDEPLTTVICSGKVRLTATFSAPVVPAVTNTSAVRVNC